MQRNSCICEKEANSWKIYINLITRTVTLKRKNGSCNDENGNRWKGTTGSKSRLIFWELCILSPYYLWSKNIYAKLFAPIDCLKSSWILILYDVFFFIHISFLVSLVFPFLFFTSYNILLYYIFYSYLFFFIFFIINLASYLSNIFALWSIIIKLHYYDIIVINVIFFHDVIHIPNFNMWV